MLTAAHAHADTPTGLRGYKLWSVLRRDEKLSRGLGYRTAGIDPHSAAREHGNVVVATNRNLRNLCELAARLNHTAAMRQAETTGIDIALPARSESCTSVSVPMRSLSAGMPESSSFS